MINRIHARLWSRPGRTAAAFLLLLPMLLTLFGPVWAGAENLNASGVVNRQSAVDLIGKTEGYSAVLYDNTNGLPTGNRTEVIPSGVHDEWELLWLQAGNKVSTLVGIRQRGVK